MPTLPKGLATAALIKTRYDEGKDHLGLFEPFVEGSLYRLYPTDFNALNVKSDLFSRRDIDIPISVVKSILNRFVKRGILSRSGGRYFFEADLDTDSIAARDDAIREYAHQIEAMSRKLAEYVGGKGLTTDLAPVDLLTRFVEINKVPIVLTEPIDEHPVERTNLSVQEARVTALFIQEFCLESRDYEYAFSLLVEGIVLRDTLLLNDVPDFGRKLDGLQVFLDTPIALAAIGLYGEANGESASEGLKLLRDAGARISVFDVTVEEIRTILSAYERKLKTSRGRLELYQTDLTHYVLSNRLESGDIAIISSTLENRLGDAGVSIKGMPKRKAAFTLDESALAESLVDPEQPHDTTSPRINHDVDCVAAVLSLRKGVTNPDIGKSIAVFLTNSGRVIKNTQNWYRREGGKGVPPIVHQTALGNIAWLKTPAQSGKYQINEFATICKAVLKPSRKTWESFVGNLIKMRNDSAISDDEAVALIVSDITEAALVDAENEDGTESDTIQEAISRVRQSYMREAEMEAKKSVQEAERRAAQAEEEARTRIADAEKRADEAALARTKRVEAMQSRTLAVSRLTSKLFYAVSIIFLLAAGIVSIPGVFESLAKPWSWVARTLVGVAALFGLWSALHGATISSFRRSVARRTELITGRVLYGRDYVSLVDSNVESQKHKAV